jgi:hypothetical protein
MNFNFHELNNVRIAEVISDEIVLNNVQDSLDLMANADYQGARKIILHEKNINPEFFKLSTGLAGEILQKYVNYKIKLAIVGDFTKYQSNSFNAFLIECNRGNQFFFVDTSDKAIEMLADKKVN